jgi:hypothetical protein
VGSCNWLAAFSALARREKPIVIDYARRAASYDIPRVKYYCYRMCMISALDDLVPLALADVNDGRFVGFVPNLLPGEDTVGFIARK